MNELINNKKKWELLYEKIMVLNYGDIISHGEIAIILDEPYDTNIYRAAIARAKKSLLKIGKFIESVQGKGYRVVAPDDYNKLTISQFAQGVKKIKKGNDILTYAPTNDMSDIGRDIHRNITDRCNIIYASVTSSCVELNLLSKKNHALLPQNIRN